MKKIIMIYFALVGISAFAQIGVGTEDPQASLDIDPKNIKVEKEEDRYIRLEGLDKRPDYLRKIVLDGEGNVATMDYDPNNFNLKTLKYTKSQNTVYTVKGANVMDSSKEALNLELDLELMLSPNTENILFLEYDVPIYIYDNTVNDKVEVGYMGVTMIKKGDNDQIVELDQGSRKMTNYENRSSITGDNFMGISIAGKAVDKLSNNLNIDKKVTYKLYGYVEKGVNIGDKAVYFGNGDGKIESLGIGVFNIAVYEKVIKRTE